MRYGERHGGKREALNPEEDRRTLKPEELKLFVERVMQLKSSGWKISEIARMLRVGRTTINERLRRYKAESPKNDDAHDV